MRAGVLAPGGAEPVWATGEAFGARAITLSHGPHRKHHGLALAPDGLRDGHTGSAPFRRQDAGPLGMGSDRASPHLVLKGRRPGCVARGLPYKAQGVAP